MEKNYYEQEWEKLKEETRDKPKSSSRMLMDEAGQWPMSDAAKHTKDFWQRHKDNMKIVRSWPSVDTPTNRPITEEEFKEHCGPEVYAKVEEIRRERRFYDIMEGKIECSEEMKKFWPIVDTSTNARRQVPEPWPWWFTLIGMIGGLIWFYVILKYLIAPN